MVLTYTKRRPESINRSPVLFYPESIRMRRMLESLNEKEVGKTCYHGRLIIADYVIGRMCG